VSWPLNDCPDECLSSGLMFSFRIQTELDKSIFTRNSSGTCLVGLAQLPSFLLMVEGLKQYSRYFEIDDVLHTAIFDCQILYVCVNENYETTLMQYIFSITH
jgi:hypothetical protein